MCWYNSHRGELNAHVPKMENDDISKSKCRKIHETQTIVRTRCDHSDSHFHYEQRRPETDYGKSQSMKSSNGSQYCTVSTTTVGCHPTLFHFIVKVCFYRMLIRSSMNNNAHLVRFYRRLDFEHELSTLWQGTNEIFTTANDYSSFLLNRLSTVIRYRYGLNKYTILGSSCLEFICSFVTNADNANDGEFSVWNHR